MSSLDIPKLDILSSTMAGKYKNLISTLAILAIIGVGISAFLFYQYQKTQKELQTIKKATTASQGASSDQLSKIVAEVGKIMKLPEGEVPTMATISDISKLKEQAFFQNGKNGDILLVYNKAGKAILYNPTEKKIVEIAPVGSTGTPASSPGASATRSPSPTPTPTPFQPKILLRNGTMTPNLAAKVEGEIKKVFPSVIIVGKENAARNTYEKTILVVLNQTAKETAQNIAKSLSAAISDLPSAEQKPLNADILIVVGKDKI